MPAPRPDPMPIPIRHHRRANLLLRVPGARMRKWVSCLDRSRACALLAFITALEPVRQRRQCGNDDAPDARHPGAVRLRRPQHRQRGRPSGRRLYPEYFHQQGYETIGRFRVQVPIRRHTDSTLQLSPEGPPLAVLPLLANSISPGTLPAAGVTGPLIYAGQGNWPISTGWRCPVPLS